MGLTQEQIKEQLGNFSEKHGPKVILPATVTAVNDDDTVALLFSDGSTVDDARLRSVVNEGNKQIFIPVVGSVVLAAKIENSDEYVIIAVEAISEVKTVVDTVNYSLNTDGFLLQKGTDTLLDALVTFIEAVEPIIIFEGRNPDYIKLATAKTKIQNILR